MTLQQLIYIVEIEKTRSFTWAADNLFMSQPNLSRSIRELEKGLGFDIFRRTSQGMIPTREGSELIDRAKRIIFQMESINEIGVGKLKRRQTFGISVPHLSYVALALRDFMNDLDPIRPIDIDYYETDTMQAVENLYEQRHNLAVVRYKSELEAEARKIFEDYSLTADTICESEMFLLISKQHPLAVHEHIDRAMLADFIEIKYCGNSLPVQGHAESGAGRSLDSEKQAVIYSHGSQFDLLSGNSTAFMWATPLPAEVLARESLVMRPCSVAGETYTDVLLHRSSYKFTSYDESFITHLHNAAKKFIFINNIFE